MSRNPDRTLQADLASRFTFQTVPARAAISRKNDERTHHQLLRESSLAKRFVADISSNPILICFSRFAFLSKIRLLSMRTSTAESAIVGCSNSAVLQFPIRHHQ